MSIEALNWALNHAPAFENEDPRKRPHLVLVLIGLANHADNRGRNAFPSNETLCRYTRLSESTVRRCLKRLLELGVIRLGDSRIQALQAKKRYRRSTVYDLAMSEVSYGPSNKGIREETDAHTSPAEASYQVDRGVTPAEEIGRMTPKPSLNHPGNRPQSIEDQVDESNDPPTSEPSSPAAELVAGLNFGKHPRPSQAQAADLARKVDAAAASGLTLIEIRRHAQAKLNQATTNAVAYLARGLDPDNLPISTPGMAHRPAPAARNAVRTTRSVEAEAAWQAARRALPSRHGTRPSAEVVPPADDTK
ncbi:Helix-turn-helix domain-containing protein [Actinokineospora iranica]|uniref:Helix-turn-helix domain-containing protein n=2 Tax=Actinokineospora iranica TaxID=1271860 RepID=A0A1G6VZN7_9PSEU|nr:Helix-turn-helix domain-containing protein [Actinokineospora iranica]